MRRWGWVTVVLSGALVLAACGGDSKSERSERRRTTTTATTAPRTTPTTVGPQTVPVPPTPAPPPTTGPPSAITVPRRTPRTTTPEATPGSTTAPDATPRTTPEPTVTAAPGNTINPARATRKTVVYSPPDAPRRRGDLVLPLRYQDTIVVLVHNGAGTRKQMRGWADFYAEHGYASFAIDYLLARASTPLPVYAKPETDVKAAVQYLRGRAEQLGLDPDRIVVQGFATGAALGAQAEVTPGDPFFGGAGHYPDVSDTPAAFIGFYGLYDGSQRNPARYYGGPPDSSDPTVQERYAKADSIAQAANAAGPVLIVQGDADEPEVVASATQFVDALDAAGKDVTLSAVADADTGFDHERVGALTPAGQQAAQQVLEWLETRFPPQ